MRGNKGHSSNTLNDIVVRKILTIEKNAVLNNPLMAKIWLRYLIPYFYKIYTHFYPLLGLLVFPSSIKSSQQVAWAESFRWTQAYPTTPMAKDGFKHICLTTQPNTLITGLVLLSRRLWSILGRGSTSEVRYPNKLGWLSLGVSTPKGTYSLKAWLTEAKINSSHGPPQKKA